jgi:hypothetical protein
MADQLVSNATATAHHTFPTEVVDLPSRGVFYPEGSPLRSGQIEIKYMTAKEEDILTSTNLIQKGIVLDKLMDSLIVTKGVKSADLLIGDLNAVMVASRILGYGKDYSIEVSCPKCGESIEEVVDLTTLKTENEPTVDTKTDISIVLPVSKATVTLKLLTRNDELNIEKENKALKKANLETESETTSRLRAMITSVNGDSNPATIWKFVDNLLVRDARYVREQYKLHVPDVDFNVSLECTCSTDPISMRLPIGVNFFWPDSRV